MIRKKLVSMLSAIALVLSLFTLLPEGALKAWALSGTGTQSNPYVVTTYDELRDKFISARGTTYIKLGADIDAFDLISQNDLWVPNNSTVHFDLAGHFLNRKSQAADDAVFAIRNNSTLIMDDTVGGSYVTMTLLSSSDARTPRYVFDVNNGGTLIINGGEYHTNHHPKDCIIKIDNANLTVNGGSFYASHGESSASISKVIKCSGSDSNLTFNGGKFYSDTEHGGVEIYITDDVNLRLNYLDMIDTSTSDAFFYTSGSNIFDYIPENAVVIKNGEKLSRSEHNYGFLSGNRILIYTPEDITGFYWDGYKLKWNDYSNPSTNYYNINLEKKNGNSYNTVKQDIITGATSFDFEEYIKANGAGTYKVLIAAFTKEHEQISNLMSTEKYFDPRETVSEISLAVTEPKDGSVVSSCKPTISSSSESRYVIKESAWFKGTTTTGVPMNTGAKFVEGETYTLYCNLVPANGYKFTSPTAKVNGKTAQASYITSDGSATVRYTVTVTSTVSTVDIGVTEPAAGASPDFTPVITTQGVELSSAIWYKNTLDASNKMSATDKFEAGEKYILLMGVRAASGYEFSSPLTSNVNGKEAATLKIGNAAVITAEFECEAGETFEKGDVNQDGQVSLLDVVFLSRAVSGVESFKQYLIPENSFDGNDEVSRLDVVLLSRRVSKGNWD